MLSETHGRVGRRELLLGIAAAGGSLLASRCSGVSDEGGIQVPKDALRVDIDAGNVQRGVSRHLFGEGLIFGLEYMWDWDNQRMYPELLEMIKDLNSDCFGHLGGPGVIVHDYRWKNVIGPREKRTDPTPRFGAFDAVNGLAGTHEYGLMLEEYRNAVNRDILSSIQVNVMTGAPEEAADWVEYMNGSPGSKWGAVRAENGHREPFNIEYWELGNQPHYTFANIGSLTGVEYSKRVREFTTAMKQRDPSIKVTAYLPFGHFNGTAEEAVKIGTYRDDVPGGPGSNGLTWTQLVLKEAGEFIDALDWHWYGAVRTSIHGYEFVMSSAYKGLLPQIERTAKLVSEAQISDKQREKLLKFVAPEYGSIAGNQPSGEETATAVYGAVANSRLLHLFTTRDDLRYAMRFGLFSPYPKPAFATDSPAAYVAIHGRDDGSGFLGTAVYQMKRLWARAWQPKLVSSQVANSPAFASTGVPVLDASAMKSEDGKSMGIVLTNTGAEAIQPALVLREFKPAPKATRLLVTGELTDDNRWEHRDTVKIQESEVDAGSTITLELPKNSVTALLLKRG